MIPLRQISDAASSTAAIEGVIVRDPTRDKKLIEWCMRIPLEQFVKEGTERRLIREYMRGIVPDHILNIQDKGVQASDFRQRITREWEQIKIDCLAAIEQAGDSEWIELDKLRNTVMGDPSEYDSWKLYSTIYTTMMLQELNRLLQI